MDVGFLRDYHRHVFHVKLGVTVSHGDRDVEFFQLKRKVCKHLLENYDQQQFEKSCEMIASELMSEFGASFVEVSEDGENGATVEQDNEKCLSAWETKKKCFIGIESEGPLRGEITLFVPGSVSVERFDAVSLAYLGIIDAVYYGAGNDKECSDATWDHIYKYCDEHCLLVSKEEEYCVFVKTHGHFVKTEDDASVVWHGQEDNSKWVTLKSDPLYQSDIYVE